MDCKITLISETYTPDAAGVQKAAKNEHTIYGDLVSAGQGEHFAAAQSGLRDELKVDIYEFEYSGEKSARLAGRTYEIYRTYHRATDGKRELYLGERGGKV